MKLLLAEDDAILADALSANLALAGFEVDVAPNGAVAEYLLLRQQFDLGVLDLGLPLVDGLTVLKRVRAARPTLPMLVLTALDGLDHRVGAGDGAAELRPRHPARRDRQRGDGAVAARMDADGPAAHAA